MDVTNGAIDRVTAQIQPALATLVAALKGGEDAISADEAVLVDAFHSEIAGIVAAETALVKQILDGLDEQRQKLMSEVRELIDGFTVTNTFQTKGKS